MKVIEKWLQQHEIADNSITFSNISRSVIFLSFCFGGFRNFISTLMCVSLDFNYFLYSHNYVNFTKGTYLMYYF